MITGESIYRCTAPDCDEEFFYDEPMLACDCGGIEFEEVVQ